MAGDDEQELLAYLSDPHNPFGVSDRGVHGRPAPGQYRRPIEALPDPLTDLGPDAQLVDGQLVDPSHGAGEPSEVVAMQQSRKGWWSNDNQIGKNQVRQAYPPTDGGIVPVLDVGEFGIPQVLTCVLNREPLTQDPPTNADVFARVEYGTGAYRDVFEVDWGNSMQFSIQCVSMRVFAVTEPRQPLTAYVVNGGDTSLQLGAAVGQYSIAAARPPTRSLRLERNPGGLALVRLPSAALSTAPVPPFARSMFVSADPMFMDPSCELTLLDIAGIIVWRATLDTLVQKWVPIPPSQTLRAQQFAYPFAAGIAQYRISFELGL